MLAAAVDVEPLEGGVQQVVVEGDPGVHHRGQEVGVVDLLVIVCVLVYTYIYIYIYIERE